MHRMFILSYLPLVYLLLLAFLLFGHMSQVFRVYVLIHRLRFCDEVLLVFYCCTLHMSVWPALFCQTGWM